jgi:hypothetical protein
MRKKQIQTLFKRVFLLLLLTVSVNSCKKDLVAPKKTSKVSKEIGTVESIAYSTFLKSINLEKIGPLKDALLAKSNTETSTKTNSISGEFELDMVNVKKLTLKDGISYVIGVKPQTKRAIQFQNVTIQEKNSKTTAFLTTYIPTKKWIEEWKKGIQTDSLFRGEIYSQSINLTNLPNPNITLSTQSTNTTSKTAITINGKLLNLAPGECEFYDIYQTVYIPCKEGHATRGECNFFTVYGTWDEQPNDWPPYAHLVYAGNVVYCEPTSSGGSGSGGGSGSTTPNPPEGYDPCDCNTPPPNGNQSIKTNSTDNKLLVIPANCCDGETEPPPYQFTLEDIEILKEIKAEDAITDEITSVLKPLCYGTNRTGNAQWRGTIEHWIIQYDYMANNLTALREYSIPNASNNTPDRRGYADLVNMSTGEIFEIKSALSAGNGVNEAQNYVNKANESCKTSTMTPFVKGAAYPTRYFPHPLLANKVLKAELNQAGLIVYSTEDKQNVPQTVPAPLPQALAKRVKDFVEKLLQNPTDMERRILAFLRVNPQIVPYLKAAAAAIIIGTIVEDVLTGGAGIADDWASFVAARTIYRLALKIP